MNEAVLQILDKAVSHSLWFFLFSFLFVLIYVAIRTRRRRRGLIDYIRSEVDRQYQDRLLGTQSEETESERRLMADDRWRTAGRSLLFSLILTLLFFAVIVFTPLSFFKNFATTQSWSVQPLRLTALSYDRFYEGFSLKGEVWNQTEEDIPGLTAVVRIFDQEEVLLDEIRNSVSPAPLPSGTPGTFEMRYEKNSPFIRGYRIFFEDAAGLELQHARGFDSPL